MPAPAVVLLSGGLDSATCLALLLEEGREVVAVSFRYGQRHAHELDAAADLAAAAGVEHLVLEIDLGRLGGSALTDDAVPVPPAEEADGSIPVTYVPARNTVFLAHALAVAEVRGADEIVVGVNALDYSGYPDCRPAFVAAFEELANLATRAGVEAAARGERALRIRAPLIDRTKAEIIRLGTDLGVDYAATTSCYDPPGPRLACGRCEACHLRRRGFAEAGVPDPTRYGEPAR